AVPLGLFAALAGILVLPVLGGGDAEIDHLATARKVAHFGIGPEIAHQNDLVHTACHGEILFNSVPGLSADAHLRRAPTLRLMQALRLPFARVVNTLFVPFMFHSREQVNSLCTPLSRGILHAPRLLTFPVSSNGPPCSLPARMSPTSRPLTESPLFRL